MENKKTALLMTFAVLASAACTNKSEITEKDLTGNWIEVMPVNKNYVQGITMNEGGEASSIGMATLKYEKWKLLDKGQIVLEGKSIGNGQTIDFSDTLSVISLNNDTLTLGKGEMYRIQYTRQDSVPQAIGGSDAAMGYTYSEVLKKKIRVFEDGEKVVSATDPNSSYASFIVFAPDSSQAELFMPEGSVVLDHRKRPDGASVWNVEDDDTYMIEKFEGNLLVSRRGKLLYSTLGTEDKLDATFTTGDGKEVKAAFYQKTGVVQISFDGQQSVLKQYRTASGYGYADPVYDLRGKGDEATLTRKSDGKKIQLKEKR